MSGISHPDRQGVCDSCGFVLTMLGERKDPMKPARIACPGADCDGGADLPAAIPGWFVEITREEPFENILIGPFDDEAAATEHAQFSADVEDWCYGEAKAKGYVVDDVLIVENPTLIPSYGINAPVYPVYEPGHPLGILPGTEKEQD